MWIQQEKQEVFDKLSNETAHNEAQLRHLVKFLEIVPNGRISKKELTLLKKQKEILIEYVSVLNERLSLLKKMKDKPLTKKEIKNILEQEISFELDCGAPTMECALEFISKSYYKSEVRDLAKKWLQKIRKDMLKCLKK